MFQVIIKNQIMKEKCLFATAKLNQL